MIDKNMIKDVAIALCKADNCVYDWPDYITVVTENMLPPDGYKEGKGYWFRWRSYTKMAEAALEVIYGK